MASLTFLVIFLVLITLIVVVPLLLRRFHIPSVVAVMVVGIVIGPNALNLIEELTLFLGTGYPTESIYGVLDSMGLLGMVFLMALAGMEVNLRIVRAEKRSVAWLSLLTFTLPMATGYLIYACFQPSDTIGSWVYASLFASHSVGVVFATIRELNVLKTRLGIIVLASTIITDMASLVVFAVTIQFHRHLSAGSGPTGVSLFDRIVPGMLGAWFPVVFVAVIAVFIFMSFRLVPRVSRWFFSSIRSDSDAKLTVFLASLLVIAFAGELIGISLILSSFIGGMALAHARGFPEEAGLLFHKIEGLAYGLFIPFLFLTIGMKTDLGVLLDAWNSAAIVGATVVGLVASKAISGWSALRISGFGNRKALCAGIMTTPQLDATLAAAAVALQLDMISPTFFNAIVCLSLFTALPAPILLKLFIRKFRIRFDQAEDALRSTSA